MPVITSGSHSMEIALQSVIVESIEKTDKVHYKKIALELTRATMSFSFQILIGFRVVRRNLNETMEALLLHPPLEFFQLQYTAIAFLMDYLSLPLVLQDDQIVH